jgi:biopolymer transport protein ExbD
MSRRARVVERHDIDISPLIDMVFILLIFFLVTSSFVKDVKLDLERPGARSATPASEKSLRVHVDVHGEIYVDGAPVRPWMVQSRVQDALRALSDKQVLVVVDQRTSAEKLVEVVDQCRLAGATAVGVATASEAG